ncbi:hypothetical protein [Methanothermococcus sp.]|uniref:hypothetical protein n=1 Tax=Methanothermococcus sp. TaxID=2614238 RepID=UPI0025D6829C|nr:hypothetical protein [Methanothermococcus sp.]
MKNIKKIKKDFLNTSLTSRVKIILMFGILSIMVCSANAEEVAKIVDNSPYPNFIYTDNSMVSKITSKNSEENIPSFFFYFINGVYINLENTEEIAIKTPLWFLGILFKSNNINPENGYIFINSKYIKKPDNKWVKYIAPSNVILYSNKSAVCMNAYDKYIGMKIVTYKSDDLKELIAGLKSINGIKVINSSAETKNNILIGNLKLKTNISKIMDLTKFDLYYVPLHVEVKGWNKKDQNTYTDGYNIMQIYKLPINKEAMKHIICNKLKNQSMELVDETHYNGWDVEEYRYKDSIVGEQYVCFKEFEYGSICAITQNLENLNDITISEINQ